MDYTALGERIRMARVKRRLTQGQAARMAGISPSFLGHIERGTRRASVETIVAISNALETRTDLLLADSLTADSLLFPGMEKKDDGLWEEILRVLLEVAERNVRKEGSSS